MNLRAAFRDWLERYDALSLRERGIVALLVAVVMYTTVQLLMVDPLVASTAGMERELRDLQTQVQVQRAEIAAIRARNEHDPNAELRTRLERLTRANAELDERLKARMRGFIQPAQMARALEEVLSQKTSLSLYQVRSLAPQPLLAEPVTEATASGEERVVVADPQAPENELPPMLYRHGLEIEFRGSYMDTLAYLRALEQLPWEFYWDGVALEVEDYPRARVVITVYTLSLGEGWIGV